MPIYVIRAIPDGTPVAMIEAALPSQAMAFAARSMMAADVAKPSDLINLTKRGMEVQVAGSAGQQLSVEGAA